MENFALIHELDLPFDSGFSVLTGETGAGKSIVIDALSLLLGARASSEVIRTGCDRALVQGAFDTPPLCIPLLQEMGIMEEDTLIISRELQINGKNRVRLNGKMASLSQLTQLAPFLVDILGQHEYQRLLNEDQHMELLDAFGDKTYQDRCVEVRELYQRLHSLKNEYSRLKSSEQERNRKLDLLQYQIDEIKEAALSAEEDESLRFEHKLLTHGEKLKTALFSFYALLQDKDSDAAVLDQVGFVQAELRKLLPLDNRLEALATSLEEAYAVLSEVSREFRDLAEQYLVDEERLQWVEERMVVVHRLTRKYGENISQVLEFYEACLREYETLSQKGKAYHELEGQIEEAREKLKESAAILSEARGTLAQTLSEKVVKELAALSMAATRFVIQVTKREEPSVFGFDAVQFLFSANEGEQLRSLARIASGGELSRIMLALKVVLSHTDTCSTLVFDEVDAGMGGRTALGVGEKLKLLSERSQVLSVTHLPTVAAYGHHHYRIEKQTEKGRTFVTVKKLSGEERLLEMVRMLGATQTDQVALEHAQELLRKGSGS